jgi:predicted nucleotidyltransferase
MSLGDSTLNPTIQSLRANSELVLSEARAALSDICSCNEVSVAANGSIARMEFSSESDLDYSIIVSGERSCDCLQEIHIKVQQFCKSKGIRLPAQDGAFGTHIAIESLYKTIGGKDDTNENLTRRLLTLLEATALDGGDQLNEIRGRILDRYLERLTPKNVARFLLNDIIRYYRTMCVDFEYKTRGGKSWGDRRIKLSYSRKLIYLSGILAVLDAVGTTRDEIRSQLLGSFSSTPIERIARILGPEQSTKILGHYEYFLEEMSNRNTRQELEHLNSPDLAKKSTIFNNLKIRSEEFNSEIFSVLVKKYSFNELELLLL